MADLIHDSREPWWRTGRAAYQLGMVCALISGWAFLVYVGSTDILVGPVALLTALLTFVLSFWLNLLAWVRMRRELASSLSAEDAARRRKGANNAFVGSVATALVCVWFVFIYLNFTHERDSLIAAMLLIGAILAFVATFLLNLLAVYRLVVKR